ncbi:ankyrin repeat protein [Anaerohalosphaera lusitana]|uniref:Ankyrin repeat protein n=1 Tax=Anaerohalosphaera lusitana TaxID=1936003 RepID=A0A1U9NHS2_9BACT|nr:ankyrin repeat domain-containing protein [Anaerohalosphaera lusitana]AQT67471.1 ankyrin repeat protein [Anaerohalosphaera lusitana]
MLIVAACSLVLPITSCSKAPEDEMLEACKDGDWAAMQNVFDRNPDILQGDKGVDILIEACKAEKADIAAKLIQAGVDVDGMSSGGVTPLVFSLRTDKPRMVKLLLRYDADPNKSAGTFELHPIFYAIRSGNIQNLSLLIEAGTNVNVKTSLGWTPLHVAVNTNTTNAQPRYSSAVSEI